MEFSGDWMKVALLSHVEWLNLISLRRCSQEQKSCKEPFTLLWCNVRLRNGVHEQDFVTLLLSSYFRFMYPSCTTPAQRGGVLARSQYDAPRFFFGYYFSTIQEIQVFAPPKRQVYTGTIREIQVIAPPTASVEQHPRFLGAASIRCVAVKRLCGIGWWLQAAAIADLQALLEQELNRLSYLTASFEDFAVERVENSEAEQLQYTDVTAAKIKSISEEAACADRVYIDVPCASKKSFHSICAGGKACTHVARKNWRRQQRRQPRSGEQRCTLPADMGWHHAVFSCGFGNLAAGRSWRRCLTDAWVTAAAHACSRTFTILKACTESASVWILNLIELPKRCWAQLFLFGWSSGDLCVKWVGFYFSHDTCE